jgi:hypothetical protein
VHGENVIVRSFKFLLLANIIRMNVMVWLEVVDWIQLAKDRELW